MILPDFCLVEVATALSVTNGHRRRRSSPLKAKWTFQWLHQSDVDHRRCRVVVTAIGIGHHGNDHLQPHPHQ